MITYMNFFGLLFNQMHVCWLFVLEVMVKCPGFAEGRVEVSLDRRSKNQLRLTLKTSNKSRFKHEKSLKIRQLWNSSKTCAGPLQEHLMIVVYNTVMRP